MMQRLRIALLFALVGCADPAHNPLPDAYTLPDAPAYTPSPECAELAPTDAACCRVFCEDPTDFDARCAPAGVCVTYVCYLTDGSLIAPEACGPTEPPHCAAAGPGC